MRLVGTTSAGAGGLSSTARARLAGPGVLFSISPRSALGRPSQRTAVTFSGSDETISLADEGSPKQTEPTMLPGQTTGFDHVRPHPQRDISRIPPERPLWLEAPGRKAMIEVVTALFVFLSAGVFLAHAFDAYRMR
jgi:hypothetical protein